jgi:hypothetical protein
MQWLASKPEISDEIVGFHAQQAVEVAQGRARVSEYRVRVHARLRRLIGEVMAAVGEFPFDTPEVVALTEHAVPLRYDEILDTEPLDRQAVARLVEEVSEWADAQLHSDG